MGETIDANELRKVVRDGVPADAGVYRRRGDGTLVYRGVRPGAGWHRHGYLARWLWVVQDGALVRVRAFKQRWFLPCAGHTCHSRPADELGGTQASALLVVLTLWAWLDGGAGVQHYESIVRSPTGDYYPSPRTVQRWLRRALPLAMSTQQALRRAVIERIEPRPVERLFRCGLSPPATFQRRRWKAPTPVFVLWTGLAIVLKGAVELDLALPQLLAEARGRWLNRHESFLI